MMTPFVPLLSDAYLAAIGMSTAQWGYFEAQFDAKLSILRRSGEAVKLSPKVPKEFRKRANLMKDSATVCFPTAPTLVSKIHALVDTASDLAGKRHVLIHGLWLSVFDEVNISTKWDGSGEIYKVPIEEIVLLAGKIGLLHTKLVFTFIPPVLPSETDEFLTSDEKRAMQAFQENNLLPPAAPRSRPLRQHTFRA